MKGLGWLVATAVMLLASSIMRQSVVRGALGTGIQLAEGNVDSVTVSLVSFDRPVIWIAGGRHKGSPYAPLAPLVRRHVKAALLKTSEQVPVAGGELALGTWQGLYVWEHRSGSHRRQVAVHVLGE